MTDYSRMTKAELIEHFEDAIERAVTAAKRGPDLTRVPEADALAGCIRAIDALQESKGRSRSIDYGFGQFEGRPARATGAVADLLRSLADKYDVSLVETKTVDCHRQHLDEISPDRLVDALRIGGAR